TRSDRDWSSDVCSSDLLAQDRTEGTPGASLRFHQRLDRLGSAFVVVFALTITAAAYDWLASLDPSWASTMFAVYVFAGVWVGGKIGRASCRERGERSVV